MIKLILEVIYIKKLIIAEKPDVMKKFMKALEPNATSTCFAKPYVYYYEGTHFVFASACGHLFKAQSPERINSVNKKWSMSPLVLPDNLPLELISSSKEYFKCIQSLLKTKNIDEVVVCTDPDREGQLIWALIAQNLSIKVPISRVWIKEWTSSGLTKAFNTRMLNSTYKNLETAGLCRLTADYFLGLTGTRVNTCCFGGYKNMINEGRVQSPTKYIVGKNEQAILNFKPEQYSVIELNTTSDESSSLLLNSEKLDETEATVLNTQLPHSPFIIHKTEKQTKKGCPLLYKTNDILVDASQKLSLSAEKVTDILQKLYMDYGLTTYPRTEIQQISVAASKDVMKIVNSLDGIGLVDEIIDEIKDNHLTFQKHLIDSAGGEMPHEAITPTYDGHPSSILSKLSTDEKDVYTLIVKRFLQGFFPPAIIAETKVETNVEYLGKLYPFKNSGKMIIEANWMKISGIPRDSLLPKITDGQKYNYVSSIHQKKQTTPPARFTEASLLVAMENAGRYVEDEESKRILKQTKGIGTGATREGIIKNLFKNGSLIKKGKTIYPSEKLMAIVDLIPESPLTSPKMTADLESKLSDVESGKLSFDDFMKDVHTQIDEIIEAAKKAPQKTISTSTGSSSSSSSDLGVCPFCGRPMRENTKSFYCPGYKEGCSFSIWKEIAGKKITTSIAKSLISKGSTGKLKGFTNKEGYPFEAKLTVNKSTHKIEFKDVKRIYD